MTRQELQERLIEFVVIVDEIAHSFDNSRRSFYYSDQLIRSSASVALNYGEALSAESKKDFVHKVKVILKELRETYAALSIVQRLKISNLEGLVERTLRENNELISIFVKTAQTAQKTKS